MSIFEHGRTEVFNPAQHPYKHPLSDFSYNNPALPGVTNLEATVDWLVAVLYPNALAAVANPAALPAAGNTLLDYRVVTDDGDGKAASYRWEQREGDVAAKWYKIYDMDWGEQTILSNFLVKTQDVYAYKYGHDDVDDTGALLAGSLAGQFIYGGASANSHLTLYANSGDGVGADTGFIQLGDQVRPLTDNAIDLGTSSVEFKDGHFAGTLNVSTMALTGGSITDSSGAISFGDENLSTTGNLSYAVGTLSGHHVMAEIATPASPAAGFNGLYFKSDDLLYRLNSAGAEALVGLQFTSTNDNRLVRSDGTGGTALQESGVTLSDADAISGLTQIDVDNLRLDGNDISSQDVNGNISLTPNGTGKTVIKNANLTGFTQDALLVTDATGLVVERGAILNSSDQLSGLTLLDVDNLRLDGNTLSSTDLNGNILLDPNGTGQISLGAIAFPATTSSFDLGKTGSVFNSLWLDGNIENDVSSFIVSELMALRNTQFRDSGRTLAVQDGDALFYNSASGTWIASVPDSEIAHSSLSGVTTGDAGHTQFALLTGRAGGQTVQGGTAASENLILESTSNATKGTVNTANSFFANTDASFSGTWSGLDIGGSANNFRDMYSKGEFKGMRLQNFTVAGLPSFSAQNVGRLMYATDDTNLYVDTGSEVKKVAGSNKFSADQAFNGSDLVKNVDVSSQIDDARTAIIQLLDNANDFERIIAEIKATSVSNVRITTNVALPAGSYRLVVIE